MALSHFRSAAALLLAGLAAPAIAQEPAPATPPVQAAPPAEAAPAPAQPPAAGEEITVTGVRPLIVDVEEVARRCAACRRALARLQAAAAPSTGRAVRPPAIDPESRGSPDLGFNRPMDTQSAGARGMMRYSEVQTRARITSRRTMSRPPAASEAQVHAMADRYLQNLMSYVGPIVDRELQARRAPAAFAADDPLARGVSGTDITDAVIEHLDRDHGDADLLAGPRPN
jgi:hypothetical protein